jgi:hypothetical protein
MHFYKRICELRPYFIETAVLSYKIIARQLHACSGRRGFCSIFKHFAGFRFFLLPYQSLIYAEVGQYYSAMSDNLALKIRAKLLWEVIFGVSLPAWQG